MMYAYTLFSLRDFMNSSLIHILFHYMKKRTHAHFFLLQHRFHLQGKQDSYKGRIQHLQHRWKD
jgi:hypothetical protein